MTAKLHTGKCFVDAVDVGERLRSINPERVAALADSIDALGLQQPISVWSPDDDTLDLVAGLHRLEAVKKLGWEEIDCIFVDMDDLDRQLWEIDENLCRADLTDLQRAQHTAKRAELVKQKADLVNAQVEQKPAHRPSEGQAEFVEETAKATGKSKSTVRRDKARGEKIASDVQKEIAGTDIEDSGVQLDALARAMPDEQREAVKAVNLGQAKDVRDVLTGAGGQKRRSRRTSAEIRLDNFDRAIRAVSTTCSCVPMIDVPNLDSETLSGALAELRNASKHIQAFIHAHEENEPARRTKSRPARWAEATSTATTALEELQGLQSEYQDWKEGLPDNLRESAVAEKLESITEIDFDSAIETVSEAEDADLPLGFGRD